eukprot:874647-Pelagomonas_calceolata.AAC.4
MTSRCCSQRLALRFLFECSHYFCFIQYRICYTFDDDTHHKDIQILAPGGDPSDIVAAAEQPSFCA